MRPRVDKMVLSGPHHPRFVVTVQWLSTPWQSIIWDGSFEQSLRSEELWWEYGAHCWEETRRISREETCELVRESVNASATPVESNSPATAAAIANWEGPRFRPIWKTKTFEVIIIEVARNEKFADKLENSHCVKEIDNFMITRGRHWILA